jgi:tetratricopeptide (TPR) repeat protein
MLGVVRLQQERFEEARELIGRAIAVDASKAVYFNNFGAALNGLGRPVEALAAFHRAAAIRPKYADAQANLGWAYEQLGQLDEAAKYYRLALEIKPDHADALGRSLGLITQAKACTPTEAVRLCEELLKTHPTSELFTRAGNLSLAGGQTPRAVEHYEQALALDPGNAAAMYNLGNALHEQHRVSEARERFSAAAALRPKQAFWKLRAAISCPAVFQSVQAIDDFCGEISATLDRWIDAPPPASPQDLLLAAAFPNFTYAYLGRNIRPLKEKVAQLYAPYFRHAPKQLDGSGLAGRKRLGIVVTERHEGIFLRCMQGIIEGLNQDLFEVVIFCSPSGRGRLEKALGALGPEEGRQPKGCTPTFVTLPSVLKGERKGTL